MLMTRQDKIDYFHAVCAVLSRRLNTLTEWEKQVIHDYWFADLSVKQAAHIISLRRNRLTDNLPK